MDVEYCETVKSLETVVYYLFFIMTFDDYNHILTCTSFVQTIKYVDYETRKRSGCLRQTIHFIFNLVSKRDHNILNVIV